jgi:pullulanase
VITSGPSTQDFAGQSNPRFKIDRFGDWGENYPGADYTVGSGEYFITFNDQSKAVSRRTGGDHSLESGLLSEGTANGWASNPHVPGFCFQYGKQLRISPDRSNPRFKIDRFGDWND